MWFRWRIPHSRRYPFPLLSAQEMQQTAINWAFSLLTQFRAQNSPYFVVVFLITSPPLIHKLPEGLLCHAHCYFLTTIVLEEQFLHTFVAYEISPGFLTRCQVWWMCLAAVRSQFLLLDGFRDRARTIDWYIIHQCLPGSPVLSSTGPLPTTPLPTISCTYEKILNFPGKSELVDGAGPSSDVLALSVMPTTRALLGNRSVPGVNFKLSGPCTIISYFSCHQCCHWFWN